MAGNSASCAGAVGTRETAPAHMVPKAMEARCAVRVPTEKNDPVTCEAALKAWTSIAEIDEAAQEKPRPKDRG